LPEHQPHHAAIGTTVQPRSADACIAAFLAWVDRHRGWIALAIVMLFVAGYNGQWRVGDDSASYVNMAQSILAGEGMQAHEEDPHRYPGTPLLIAAAFFLAGTGAFWLANAFMLMLALATVALVYRTMSLHADRPTGVLVASIFAVSAQFYVHAHELLADLPFVFGVMLFLAGYEFLMVRAAAWSCTANRRRLGFACAANVLLMLVGLGVMMVTRRTMLIFIAALGVVCVWQLIRSHHRYKRIIFGGALAVAVVSLALWVMFDPRGEGTFTRDLMLPLLARLSLGETLSRSFWFFVQIFEGDAAYAAFGLALGPGLSTVAGAAVLAATLALIRRRLLWGVFVALFLIAMIIHMPEVRYFVAILPLMIYGWWRAAMWIARKVDVRHAPAALAVMLTLWCAPNIVRVGKVIVDQRRTPFLEHFHNGRYAALQTICEHIEANTGPDDFIIADLATVIRYQTGRQTLNWKLLNRWHNTDASELALMREHPERVFIVRPMRPELRQRVHAYLSLEPAEVIVTVENPRDKDYSLHTVRPRRQDP